LGEALAGPLADAGLTPHFRRWLEQQGLTDYDFPRDDLRGGSFGGRLSNDDAVRHQPVVFIHGNSDQAVGTKDNTPLGWSATIRFFLAHGYTPAELYATTWGPADPAEAVKQVHSWEHLSRVRAFIVAVLAYTGADKIDVVSHSMGVTLARKAIKGGPVKDPDTGQRRDLGLPLTDRVDAFVGIAGANWGLTNCYLAVWTAPTCSSDFGFFPGYLGFGGVWGISRFISELNDAEHFEGDRVYSIWSTKDQVVGYGGIVNGRYTSRIPGQDAEMVYHGYPYGHFCTRDLSAPLQLQMVREHQGP
jgi:pimeloyl-ACP methyl ester carboxylesterase